VVVTHLIIANDRMPNKLDEFYYRRCSATEIATIGLVRAVF
jgi:hypothetical protein